MKNIFFVYCGSDKERAQEFKIELEQADNTPVNAVSLENQANAPKNSHIRVIEHRDTDESSNYTTNWKNRIKPKIQKSDIVIFIQAENSHLNSNIKWEVKTALFFEKPVAVVQLGNYTLPKWLPYEKAAKKYSWDDRFKLKNEIILLETKQYDIFSKNYNKILNERKEETVQQLFEQYKLYQQTTEELENRKQSLNNFFLSLNTAMIAFCSAIIASETLSQKERLALLFFAIVTGIGFNKYWCIEINRLKIINTAKLRLINSIEQQLPLQLYYEEYKIMSNELNGWHYKNTFRDRKLMPNMFIWFYFAIMFLFLLGINHIPLIQNLI